MNRAFVPVVMTIFALSVAVATAATGVDPDKLARGKYLVTVAGCNHCHTPWKLGPNGPEPDMTRMLSGHPQDMTLPQPPKPEGPWIVAAASEENPRARSPS